MTQDFTQLSIFDIGIPESILFDKELAEIKVYENRKTCFQKIQKEKQKKHEVITQFDKETIEVKEVTYKEAKELIVKYEWLKTMPSSPWKQYGLYMNDILVAVECFARVRSGNTSYTYLGYPAISLARGASIGNAPKWVGSFLISKSLKLIEKEIEGPCYVLAYSDWEAGELGHIYQACSWIYTGHKLSPEWRSPTGERKDSSYHRQITRKIDPDYKVKRKLNPVIVKQTKERLINEGWHMSKTTRGRYVTVIGKKSPLKKEMIKELKKRAVPYIKGHVFETSIELTDAQIKKSEKE